MKATTLPPPSPNQPTVIFSDSASCLEALISPSSKHPWLLLTEQTSLSNNITFCWIPGHKGIKGNVKADDLACQGRFQAVIPAAVPPQDVVRWTKDSIRESWDSEWFNSRNSALRRIKPITLPWPDNPNPKHRRILSRLRIGHTRLTHSHLLEKSDPPSCTTCGVPLTIPHILVDCLMFDTQRVNNNLGTTLELILSPPYEEKLIKYLEETGLYRKI
jgi:hypothetical protein